MLGTPEAHKETPLKTKHIVAIAGNTYHLVCDGTDESPVQAATIVDRLIKEIMTASGCTLMQATMLAAVRLAQQHLGDQAKILHVLTTQLDQASW